MATLVKKFARWFALLPLPSIMVDLWIYSLQNLPFVGKIGTGASMMFKLRKRESNASCLFHRPVR